MRKIVKNKVNIRQKFYRETQSKGRPVKILAASTSFCCPHIWAQLVQRADSARPQWRQQPQVEVLLITIFLNSILPGCMYLRLMRLFHWPASLTGGAGIRSETNVKSFASLITSEKPLGGARYMRSACLCTRACYSFRVSAARSYIIRRSATDAFARCV